MAYGGPFDLSSWLTQEGWRQALRQEMEKEYFTGIIRHLQSDYDNKVQVFPPMNLIFNAFNLTAIDKIKVVILGQDPYHEAGQAMGMAFSVPHQIQIPSSLENIYAELKRDPKIPGVALPNGDLTYWAGQGVFLLNSILTVTAGTPESHSSYGWQDFTDQVIQIISNQCDHVVFMLWGVYAHRKYEMIDLNKHSIIATSHPAFQSQSVSNLSPARIPDHPLPYGSFRESGCFSLANDCLTKWGKSTINWLSPQ